MSSQVIADLVATHQLSWKTTIRLEKWMGRRGAYFRYLFIYLEAIRNTQKLFNFNKFLIKPVDCESI